MTNEQQVSSIGLSQRLRELGIKQESLNYWQWIEAHNGYELNNGNEEKKISAFTVAELGNMLPIGFSSFRVNPMWRGFKIGNEWCCEDGNQKLHEEYGNTEANVRCKMLIYLLENNIITVEEINKRI